MLRVLFLVIPAVAAAVLAGLAYGNPPGQSDMDQAKAAGWDCNPEFLIVDYYHCAPPGKPSVLDAVSGNTNAPNIILRVFHPDESYAGTETLRRADLYQGQACPQDNLAQWDLLDLPVDYFACHHFDT